jgi:hypothetical protein
VIRFGAAWRLFCALIIVAPAIAEETLKGTQTLPGEACQTESLPTWMPREKWVWERVCIGKDADLGARYGGPNDPKQQNGWPPTRTVRAAFLEAILLHEPFRSAVPRQGVRIIGARITTPLELRSCQTINAQILGSER